MLNLSLWLQGFVISDWQGIDRITSPPHANYSYSVQASILAGLDMVKTVLYFCNPIAKFEDDFLTDDTFGTDHGS